MYNGGLSRGKKNCVTVLAVYKYSVTLSKEYIGINTNGV
jgi:hypothetical protein